MCKRSSKRSKNPRKKSGNSKSENNYGTSSRVAGEKR